MLIPPLLPQSITQRVSVLLKEDDRKEDDILALLKGLPLEEQIHILRFLYNKSDFYGYLPTIYRVWQSLVPLDHPLNTSENRRALYYIGQWWDAFGCAEGMTIQRYDELEQVLDTLGATSAGKEFFTWVALYPVGILGIEQDSIWDEERRGAIVCLGKYACGDKHTELFLARHLDDWNTIQVEVVYILAARKSRLLAKLAPWYIAHDDLLQPIIEEFI